jgi:hypothetical protein
LPSFSPALRQRFSHASEGKMVVIVALILVACLVQAVVIWREWIIEEIESKGL